MGGFVPNMGDKVLMGEGGRTHEEGHRPYERGPNLKRLHHKLKVLLLLMILL